MLEWGIAILFSIIQRRQNKRINEITTKRLKSFYFSVNWQFANIHDEIFRQNINTDRSWSELKKEHTIIGNSIAHLFKLFKENSDILDIEVERKLTQINDCWNYNQDEYDQREQKTSYLLENIKRISHESIKYIQKKYF